MCKQTNFIDFKDEHRIYLIEGSLEELVGMIAVTNFDDDYEDFGKLRLPSPVTHYKFIINPNYMCNGGYFCEGNLPNIFAHRGDTIKVWQIMEILLKNIYFHIESPIAILEELSDFELKVDPSEAICDIRIRLYQIIKSFRVETDLGGAIMFITISKEGDKGITVSIDGYEKFYSYRDLAIRIGKILYALRKFFHRPDIEIVNITLYDFWEKEMSDVPIANGFQKFLRCVELAALIEERNGAKI